MRKLSLCLFCMFFILPLALPDHDAMAGYCPSSKGGKCPTPRTISHKRSEFTAAQRAKFMDEARKICKKAYGASSTVYKLDYYKWRVICNEH
jgi:hypothetical protein